MDTARERLIAAAVRLFQSRGYAATGLSEILVAASCAKGSLYHHFPGGKEALACAAVAVIGTEVDRFLSARASAGHGAADTLAALAGLTGRWLERTGYTQGALLVTLSAADPAATPELTAAIEATRARWAAWFASRLALPAADREARSALATLDGAICAARLARDAGRVGWLLEPVVQRWAALPGHPAAVGLDPGRAEGQR